jgi:hypothetical protein
MKYPIATGTMVTARIAAEAIANVLVKASGLKSRPSCDSRANTGRKLTVMTSRLKKSAGPTSFDASATISQRRRSDGSPGSRSRCLWRFSTITTAASTIAPMAMAIPPMDMMLACTPISRMTTKAMRMAMGSVTAATSELRRCSRKMAVISPTRSSSSPSLSCRLAIARRISGARSYASTTRTPAGSPDWIDASRSRTASITCSAFSPWRITTIPVTTSPRPSRSATPRRMSGPSCTRATSITRTGVPPIPVVSTTFSMSSTPLR